MKRIKYILLTLAICLPGLMSAQSENVKAWKGFFDGYAGFIPGGTYERSGWLFGFNVTGGYQITDYLFAGIGFGASVINIEEKINDPYDYYNSYSYLNRNVPGLYAPIYADFRWTLNIDRTVTPFVDLKIGYKFAVPLGGIDRQSTPADEYQYFIHGDQIYYYDAYGTVTEGGLYCMPTVGIRFGKQTAFNLGIGCDISSRLKHTQFRVTPLNELEKDSFIRSKPSIVVTMGVDF